MAKYQFNSFGVMFSSIWGIAVGMFCLLLPAVLIAPFLGQAILQGDTRPETIQSFLFSLSPLLALWIRSKIIRYYKNLFEHGVELKGKVLQAGRLGYKQRGVVFSYRYQNKSYTARDSISFIPEVAKVGKTVDILIDPNKPENAIIEAAYGSLRR